MLTRPADTLSLEMLMPLRQTLEISSALMRRAAFEQAPIGKVLQTSDGLLRAVNRSLCLLLGYSEVEVLTLTVPDLVDPEAVARDWEQYQALLAGEIERFDLEKRTFSRCERAIWGSNSVSAIRDHSGQVEWLISQLEELTPGQPLARLPDSQQRTLIEEMAQLGSWEMDPETGRCIWSDEYFRICGLVPGTLSPSFERSLDWIHAEDREALAQTLRQTLETKQRGQIHCRLVRADGCMRQVLIQARVQSGPGPLRLVGLMMDVTEQWQKARLMEQTSCLLTEQNRQLDAMARTALHNLRSPVASAITLTQLLAEADSDSERQDYQTMLSDSLTQALTNLDEMVVQMYHQMPQNIPRQQVSFQTALDKALLALAPDFKSSQPLIETDFACPELEYSSVYLNSIVYNLVSNALKYRSSERRPQITLRSWRGDQRTYLEVEDNGIGIDLERAGQRLFKLHAIFTDHPEAHGIGLYLTRNQIESLGGSIHVTSEPGIGTCFRVRF